VKGLPWIALALLGLSRPALAQEALSLTHAIQEALAHNRLLQAAEAGTREADARTREARSAYFPRLSFVESWQRGDQPVFVFSSLLSARQFTAANFAIDSLNFPAPLGFFHGAISFDQTVFDGGRTGASVDASRLRSEIARDNTDNEATALVVSVTETYGRVLAARAARLAAEAATAAAAEDVTRATRRRDAGTLSDADVLALTVHLAEARQRRIQADGDESVAKAELNRLLGASIDQLYDVEEPAITDGRETASLPALFAEAESRRPDLKRAAAAERLADTGRRQSRSGWSPQLAVTGIVAADGTSFGDRSSSWIVGGELRWTLSTGGAEVAQRRAAAESLVQARLERDDARARAQVEIATAARRLDSALARQTLAQAAAQAARESERIVRDRFDAGLASTSDLLRASASTADTDAQRVAALVDIVVSRATLDRALGRSPVVAGRTSP
jgi:outer membrane protein TolC